MARARRAKLRPTRVAIPLAVAAVLLLGGIFTAWRFWPDPTTAGPDPVSSVGATESTAAAPTTEPVSPPASTSRPTSSPSASAADPAAAQALEQCRARVAAADAVIKEAKVGVGHWMFHVQAEADAQQKKISSKAKADRFKQTRLLGPGDQKRYRDRVLAYQKLDASCGKVKGADQKVAAALASCNTRAKAQQPVLKASAGAMGDWKSHLADMQRSREYHVDNAQEIWLRTYRAAPRNINAYKKAVQDFDAPAC